MIQNDFIKPIYPGCLRKLRTNGNFSLIDITCENEKLSKRLTYAKSSYQQKHFQNDYKKHLARIRMISKPKIGILLNIL